MRDSTNPQTMASTGGGPCTRPKDTSVDSSTPSRGGASNQGRLRGSALAFCPPGRLRCLLHGLLGSSTLQRCAAFFSQRDFLRGGFPTDDLSAGGPPDGDGHSEMLRDLETVIPGFLVRHAGGWGDPYGRACGCGEPGQVLPYNGAFPRAHGAGPPGA